MNDEYSSGSYRPRKRDVDATVVITTVRSIFRNAWQEANGVLSMVAEISPKTIQTVADRYEPEVRSIRLSRGKKAVETLDYTGESQIADMMEKLILDAPRKSQK